MWIGISEILEKISTTESNTRKVHIFWETKFCEIFTLLSGSDYWESTPGDAGAKALLGSAIFSVDIQNVRFIWSTYTVGAGCTKNIFSLFLVRINKILHISSQHNIAISMSVCRALGRSEIQGCHYYMVGKICRGAPSGLVEIELADLPKSGGAMPWPCHCLIQF